jgi:predicted ester cyclase
VANFEVGIAADYVLHATPEVKGPEGLRQSVITIRTAFPDIHVKVDYAVAEEDFVAVFSTMTGTFKGELAGMKPTGKKMSIKIANLTRFEGNKAVEAWQYTDSLELYRQLGIPIPQQ